MSAKMSVQPTLDGGMMLTLIIEGATAEDLDTAVLDGMRQLDLFRRGEQAENRIALALTNEYLLTAREREVARLLAQGESTKQISKALSVSRHTAESHLKNIYAKLNVHTRGHAIVALNGVDRRH